MIITVILYRQELPMEFQCRYHIFLKKWHAGVMFEEMGENQQLLMCFNYDLLVVLLDINPNLNYSYHITGV